MLRPVEIEVLERLLINEESFIAPSNIDAITNEEPKKVISRKRSNSAPEICNNLATNLTIEPLAKRALSLFSVKASQIDIFSHGRFEKGDDNLSICSHTTTTTTASDDSFEIALGILA